MGIDSEVVIVGAGIVGLATARALAGRVGPDHVVVVDKEARPAVHQSGRSSGVIHSGLYYRPGSLKARLCVAGRVALEQLCDEHGVPRRSTGKVVVATAAAELDPLAELERRGTANGVTVERIDRAELARREPAVAGVAALWVAETGVVDFGRVTEALADELAAEGAGLLFDWQVADIRADGDRVVVERHDGSRITARRAVVCAGLHAARLAGPTVTEGLRILPFRGEYRALTAPASQLVNGLVYPVPDPRFPFLGVHATRTIDGDVHLGPSAVLALAPEGYRWRDVDPRYLASTATFPGSWRLMARHWRRGAAEVARSLSTRAFLREARRLLPDLAAGDLLPASSGVRAQAVDRRGTLLDDFVIRPDPSGRVTHVLNAPSPAATAALAIGEEIAARISRGGPGPPPPHAPRRAR